MWSHGTGADVITRIAAPMIGGMVTSTILTLAVIPAIYAVWRGRKMYLHKEESLDLVGNA
jgi:copper/silver efflux system protein